MRTSIAGTMNWRVCQRLTQGIPSAKATSRWVRLRRATVRLREAPRLR